MLTGETNLRQIEVQVKKLELHVLDRYLSCVSKHFAAEQDFMYPHREVVTSSSAVISDGFPGVCPFGSSTDSGEKVIGLIWERRMVAGTIVSHLGVYRLRSNKISWDAKTLTHLRVIQQPGLIVIF